MHLLKRGGAEVRSFAEAVRRKLLFLHDAPHLRLLRVSNFLTPVFEVPGDGRARLVGFYFAKVERFFASKIIPPTGIRSSRSLKNYS